MTDPEIKKHGLFLDNRSRDKKTMDYF